MILQHANACVSVMQGGTHCPRCNEACSQKPLLGAQRPPDWANLVMILPHKHHSTGLQSEENGMCCYPRQQPTRLVWASLIMMKDMRNNYSKRDGKKDRPLQKKRRCTPDEWSAIRANLFIRHSLPCSLLNAARMQLQKE